MKASIRWSGIVLVLGMAATGGFLFWKHSRDRAKAPTYQPLKVTRGDVLVAVQATGTVQPENRLLIKPPINGRIDSIASQEGDVVKKNQVLAMMSSTDRAALLDMARAKGPAEVKHWEEIYRSTPIVAPLAGVIINRNVEPGQVIATTDAVFSMSDHLIVVAQVDETDMAKVKLAQPVTIVLDAYPMEKVLGQVKQIAFDARTVNNVTIYDVQILPAAVPDFMRSGMTASVLFKVEEHKNVLLVPAAAVRQDKIRTVVLKRSSEDDGTDDHPGDVPPVEQDIKTGLTDGKNIEVTAGLSEGDTILQEVLHLPDAKTGGSPFSPGGPSKTPGKGR